MFTFRESCRYSDGEVKIPRIAAPSRAVSPNHYPMSVIQKIEVLLVHYAPVMRVGLKSVIESHQALRVCAEADTAHAARHHCEKIRPQVVLLALVPAFGWGFAMLRDLRQRAPEASFVVLAESEDPATMQRAFAAGARSYVTHTCPAAEVVSAILHALDDELYATPRIAHLLLKNVASGAMAMHRTAEAALSERELEVFRMIAAGNSTRDVAERLGVSIKTIETHVGRLKSKLGFASINDLRQDAALSSALAEMPDLRSPANVGKTARDPRLLSPAQ